MVSSQPIQLTEPCCMYRTALAVATLPCLAAVELKSAVSFLSCSSYPPSFECRQPSSCDSPVHSSLLSGPPRTVSLTRNSFLFVATKPSCLTSGLSPHVPALDQRVIRTRESFYCLQISSYSAFPSSPDFVQTLDGSFVTRETACRNVFYTCGRQ